MKDFDYIIIGAGASGLQLADALGADPFFQNKRIALLEKQQERKNDRTWCFWERGPGPFDEILHHQWKYIRFAGPGFDRTEALAPFSYKMLRGSDFYAAYTEKIASYPNLDQIRATVQKVEEESGAVRVITDTGEWTAGHVFSSIPLGDLKSLMTPHPVLRQHFLGWFIRSENPIFDPRRATFMDFSIPQKGNTRFMYILPFSDTEGLVEYTLFSENLLDKQEYQDALEEYLEAPLGSSGYEILEIENGSIPMTSNDFTRADRPGITHIGIAGGWAKASTGYTFRNTTKYVPKLVEALKNGDDLAMAKRNRFWHYDRLLLDVLAHENHRGCEVFSGQLSKLPPQLMLRFLDEDTRIPEELRVMASSPSTPFIRAVWRSLF
jgi:lycopene beta-cyclase